MRYWGIILIALAGIHIGKMSRTILHSLYHLQSKTRNYKAIITSQNYFIITPALMASSYHTSFVRRMSLVWFWGETKKKFFGWFLQGPLNLVRNISGNFNVSNDQRRKYQKTEKQKTKIKLA